MVELWSGNRNLLKLKNGFGDNFGAYGGMCFK